MNRWLLCGVVSLSVGATAFLIFKKSYPCPCVAITETAVPAATTTPSREPLVLPHVVDLTDLSPLLDPPARPASGTPFDEVPASLPNAPPAPERIPLAHDDDEDDF